MRDFVKRMNGKVEAGRFLEVKTSFWKQIIFTWNPSHGFEMGRVQAGTGRMVTMRTSIQVWKRQDKWRENSLVPNPDSGIRPSDLKTKMWKSHAKRRKNVPYPRGKKQTDRKDKTRDSNSTVEWRTQKAIPKGTGNRDLVCSPQKTKMTCQVKAGGFSGYWLNGMRAARGKCCEESDEKEITLKSESHTAQTHSSRSWLNNYTTQLYTYNYTTY